MYSTLIDIVSKLRSVRFGRPKKNDILVFDQRKEAVLKQTILYDMDYSVFPARGEIRWIWPSLLPLCLFYWIKLKKAPIRNRGPVTPKKYRTLSFAYSLSFIRCVSPKVVLTFIDTSYLFHQLSAAYKTAVFVSIQNGFRINDYRSLPNADRMMNNRVHFMCFGQYERDLYASKGHDISRFYPIGSLMAGYYKSESNGKADNKKFSICLVSQYRDIVHENAYPAFSGGWHRLNANLAQFIEKQNIRNACVACCSNRQIETESYRKYFGDAVRIVSREQEYLTYWCMDHSEVIVSMDSTAAFEAFGWGKKVLFCNYPAYSSYPLPDSCYVEDADFNIFEDKLLKMLDANYGEYREQFLDYFKYFMNYDAANPPHRIIRKHIYHILQQNSRKTPWCRFFREISAD